MKYNFSSFNLAQGIIPVYDLYAQNENLGAHSCCPHVHCPSLLDERK